MDNPRRYAHPVIKAALLTLAASFTLAGCVSTLPPEGQKKVEPEIFEQKNLEIAHGFLQQGYPQRAISRLEEILKVNRQSARTYGMLGVVYQSQGEYDLAEKNFVRSLDIDSDASDVRNNFGVLLYTTGKYDQARKQFELATDDIYYDNRSRAFENLGFVSLQTGDREEARQLFKRALRLDQNLVRASLELTDMFHEDGNFVESERYFQNYQRLTQNSRPSPRALLLGIELARVFRQENRLADYADQLTRFYPGSAEYRKYQASLRND
ncbi:type IV pilus biogenesis/stability protein PilW [Parendozoicomonas haliclonae]|nr:type IV pilus biogenesis/stability protein PilW [Parendozoicomonas haliclonae]